MSNAGPVPRRLWTAIFAIVTMASAAPILATRYLPFTDVPEHVAAIATMNRVLHGAPGDYRLALGTSQYLLYDVVGALFTRVTGDAVLANQLLLALVAMAWPLSFRALLRALGRDERIAIFAALIFWNRALAVGFLPFVAGIPLALWALSLFVRQCETPTWRRSAALAALAVVLFYTHVSAWVIFVALSAVLFAITTLPRLPLRALAASALPLVPSALLAIVWWRSGSLSRLGEHELVGRRDLTETVSAVPIWTFDVWRTHVDELYAIAWWLAFAVIVLKPLAEPRSRRASLLAVAPFACAALVYLATPFSVGAAWYLNVRLAPLVVMCALLWLRPRRDVWGSVPLAVAAALVLVASADAIYEMRRASREMLGDFDGLLTQIRPGARLAMLNFESRSTRIHYFPYIYAGSYHRVHDDAVVFYSFTSMTHWPIHYAEGLRPPSTFSSFTPCAYRYRTDGAYYDYVLVQGHRDPFTDAPQGPQFRRVTTSGAFTLFEKVGPSTDDGEAPDIGPCAAPP